MQTRREALNEGRNNIAEGTTAAAELARSATSDEIWELAKAVHWIGFGAQQIALALTESKFNDLDVCRRS
jgi:hypothetical protein